MDFLSLQGLSSSIGLQDLWPLLTFAPQTSSSHSARPSMSSRQKTSSSDMTRPLSSRRKLDLVGIFILLQVVDSSSRLVAFPLLFQDM